MKSSKFILYYQECNQHRDRIEQDRDDTNLVLVVSSKLVNQSVIQTIK